MSYQQYLPKDLRNGTSLIVSPRDLFFIKRAEALAAGKSPAEAKRIGYEAQRQVFGSPETQRKTFGAPAERRALFAATDVSQLKFSTPKQAFNVARTQAKLQGLSPAESKSAAINFARSLPRESFGEFTPLQEFYFALSKSPQAQALRQRVKSEAMAAGLTQAEAVSLSFAAARESLGFPLTSQQQALIGRIQGQSSPQASQDLGANPIGGNGVGSFGSTGGFGGIGGDTYAGGGSGGLFGGIGGQQGIGGGLGIILLLGLFAYEATRGGKKR